VLWKVWTLDTCKDSEIVGLALILENKWAETVCDLDRMTLRCTFWKRATSPQTHPNFVHAHPGTGQTGLHSRPREVLPLLSISMQHRTAVSLGSAQVGVCTESSDESGV